MTEFICIADDVLDNAGEADLEILLADMDAIMATDLAPEQKVGALRAAIGLLTSAVRCVL